MSRHGSRLVLLALVAGVLAAAAPASAATTFGADLTQAPNIALTCDAGWPTPVFGQIELVDPGNSSCTWLSGGTAHSPYVPGSGTLTAASVRVGASTGPMRVVVLRSLFQNTVTPGKPYFACCVVQAYGPTFTPKANAVTRIPLSIPVEADPTPPPQDLTTIALDDAIGLEVLAPGVRIPATEATDELTPVFGWYPSQSAQGITAPSANVVSYDADFSGAHVLLSGELDGGGGGGGTGGGGTGGGGGGGGGRTTPAVGLPQKTLTVHKGHVGVPIHCTGAGCRGTLRLQNRRGAQEAGVAGLLARRHKRVRTYGSARFSVKAGKTKHVRVKLNRAGRRLVHKRGPAKVWANVAFRKGSDGRARSAKLKLK